MIAEYIGSSKLKKEPETMSVGIVSDRINLKIESDTQWEMKFDKDSLVSFIMNTYYLYYEEFISLSSCLN